MLTQLRVSHHSGTAHDCLHPQNNRGETELLGINTPRTKKAASCPARPLDRTASFSAAASVTTDKLV